MIDRNQISQVAEHDVYDSENKKIGKAGQVYLDDTTGEPQWVTVNTGLFGTSESFVPLQQATVTDEGLTVPYTKDKVKDAPHVEPDGHITPDEENDLFSYYGLTVAEQAQTDPPAAGDAGGEVRGTGHDTSGPNTDEAMTRSEEQLTVGTQTREAGRARLRKHVVTEEQTVTVPVAHEEVRVEREPITDANVGDATAGTQLSEEEHEIVLHEEQVVVDKKVVPVERVKLGKETVTGEQQVTEQVRKEQIEADGVDAKNVGARGKDKTGR